MQDTVQEILCTNILKITLEASIDSAVSLARSCQLEDLYVVDEHQQLLGVVPGFALVKSILCFQDGENSVERIMSRQILSCETNLPIAEIAPLFREACHERIAVTEKGKLIGQIRRCDVLQWLARQTGKAGKTEQRSHIEPPQFLKTRHALENEPSH